MLPSIESNAVADYEDENGDAITRNFFWNEDLDCQKQWRRVQHMCNEFWTRWRKEVYARLKAWQKWNQAKRNFQVRKFVLVQDDTTQNAWPMAGILKNLQ